MGRLFVSSSIQPMTEQRLVLPQSTKTDTFVISTHFDFWKLLLNVFAQDLSLCPIFWNEMWNVVQNIEHI